MFDEEEEEDSSSSYGGSSSSSSLEECLVECPPSVVPFVSRAKEKELPPNVSRIRDVPPPGPGPWWAFIMVNVGSEEDKKQAEIRLHTWPDLIKEIKNDSDSSGNWVIVVKLGPFYDLDLGLLALSQWGDETRGPQPRIAQVLCMWEKYYRKWGVQLHALSQTKREVQEVFQERKNRERSGKGVYVAEKTSSRRTVWPGFIPVRDILTAPSMFDKAKQPRPTKKQKK